MAGPSDIPESARQAAMQAGAGLKPSAGGIGMDTAFSLKSACLETSFKPPAISAGKGPSPLGFGRK